MNWQQVPQATFYSGSDGGHWVTLDDGRHIFISEGGKSIGDSHDGKKVVGTSKKHPSADVKGKVTGKVVKETEKGVLVSHEGKEGWLQKRWTKPTADGGVRFDEKHLRGFEDSEKTISGYKTLRETDKALLIHHEGTEAWVPKSVVKIEDGKMTMPKWVGEKFKPTHITIEPEGRIGETAKAYSINVSVARADGEPESHTVYFPKSQCQVEDGKLKVPLWLRDAKDAEFTDRWPTTSGGGMMKRLLW